MEKDMQKYLMLLKVDSKKTYDFYKVMTTMPQDAAEGVKIWGSYNLFGNWDFAIWFEAKDNEAAVHFVGEKIRSIDGVIETVTIPAMAMKEYM
jgi:uncharacterized protein with GYD domain